MNVSVYKNYTIKYGSKIVKKKEKSCDALVFASSDSLPTFHIGDGDGVELTIEQMRIISKFLSDVADDIDQTTELITNG